MKTNGSKTNIELSYGDFVPINDTKEDYQAEKGKARTRSIHGVVTFSAKGQATLTYKDEYNNGQLSIQALNNGVKITWTGKETSVNSFPKGTFKLIKEVTIATTEMKRIGTFLSNFTELHIERLNSNNLKDADLIYFGVWNNFVNKSIQGIKFDGRGYVFEGAFGDPVDCVKVINVHDMGSSTFEIYGELYADPYSWIEAVVKKITENKKLRHILISLSVKN